MGRKLEFDAERALHKAMKLFWRKGYEETSMQDIVNELGINRFSVYNTFGDKKALFLKSFAHYRETVLAFLLEPLVTDKPAQQRLDDYFVLLQQQLESPAGILGCMMQNTGISQVSRDDEVYSLLQSFFGDLQDALLKAVIEMHSESEEALARDRTAFILNQLQGMIYMRRALKSEQGLSGQMTILREVAAGWKG